MIAPAFERHMTEPDTNQRSPGGGDRTAGRMDAATYTTDELLGALSHALKSPAWAISGLARIAARHDAAASCADLRQTLEQVSRGAERIQDILVGVDRLRRASREPVRPARVALESIMYMVRREHRAELDHVASLEVDPELHVWGDPALTTDLVRELLLNAAKATAGAHEARIEIGAGDVPGSFYVRDNGMGCKDADTSRLFHPMEKLHPADDFPGVGLGLSVVACIARRHGGRVWLGHAGSPGTTFHVHLPWPTE